MRRFAPLLFLLAFVLAGCGGSPSLLATAIENTEDAGGAEVVFQMTMELPGLAQPMEMTGSGVEDAGERRGRLTFDMSSLASMPGVAGVCGNGCQMEVVTDGLVSYMRSDVFIQAFGGKEWLKMDLERIGSRMGLDMGTLGSVGQTASDQLQMLDAASGDLTEHGREEVAGVQTTHYSATIDMTKLPQGERVAKLSGLSMMPVGIWIDDADRVRRITMDQELSQMGLEMKMHATVEYVRFGVPVEIEVPDEDDVFDATDLMAGELE